VAADYFPPSRRTHIYIIILKLVVGHSTRLMGAIASIRLVQCAHPKAHAVADVTMSGVSEVHAIALQFVGNCVSMQVTAQCFIRLGILLMSGEAVKGLGGQGGLPTVPAAQMARNGCLSGCAFG
jgi:hypothetical protein